MLERLRGLLPIRKIAVTLLGGGLTWAAMRLGMDLGDSAANQGAVLLVGTAFGYLERDPRVKAVVDVLDPEGEKVAPTRTV